MNSLRENAFTGQLKDRKIILYEPGSGSRKFTDRLFRATRPAPNITAQSNDTDFIKRLISNHCGVALMPVFSVVPELCRGHFSAIRLDSEETRQDFGLGHLSDNASPAVKAFKEHCSVARAAPWQLTLEQISNLEVETTAGRAEGNKLSALDKLESRVLAHLMQLT